jgi:CubicO group peptidase (beta-lactamase class C family)
MPAPRPYSSLAELAVGYSQQPLKFPPGSKWEYCNAGINTLGRIVEVVSGDLYAEFVEKRLLQPLGMKDTTFWPTPAQAKRVAKSYFKVENGPLIATNVYFLRGNLSDRTRTAYPAGGLYSTASDLFKFYQMILNGGELGGKRYLSREAVALMTRTQTGELKTGFVEGMSFGFGWGVVKEPQGVTAALSPGSFGHGGAYGTQGWIDPGKQMVFVFMIQRARMGNADGSEMRKAFQEAAVRECAK